MDKIRFSIGIAMIHCSRHCYFTSSPCSPYVRAREAELEKLDEVEETEDDCNAGDGAKKEKGNVGPSGGEGAGTLSPKSATSSFGGRSPSSKRSTAAGSTQQVARNFRYMRRKPTIISYKPPEGKGKRSRKRQPNTF